MTGQSEIRKIDIGNCMFDLVKSFNTDLSDSWKKNLIGEIDKQYFKDLSSFLTSAYRQSQVFPVENNIFNAFKLLDFNDVKVVILGQDPYHGFGQAHGLAFSVMEGEKLPPSLLHIFKELFSDTGREISKNGNLENWAKQGVFLLNATLTVEANSPGSHQKKGWEQFTDSVIKSLSDNREKLVFILWGAYAQNKSVLIDESKHLVLKAPHPSPFSAYKGFFGCKHFSKTNDYLKINNKIEIDWTNS